jgi:phosphoglycerate dehydrogenase-like enzyme
MKPLLLILDDWGGRIAASACWGRIKELVEIKFLDGPLSSAPDDEITNTRFIMALRERTAFTEEVFERLPQLKLVLQTGGHAYHIDYKAANRRGITIALGRRVKAPLLSVPELTLAMCLGAMHMLPQAQAAMQQGGWPLLTGRTLANRRLGILGMGRHGSRVAEIAKQAFGMDVAAWDRNGAGGARPADIPRLSFDELLSTSDIISIHLRLSPESEKLVNADCFSKMKQGCILINTARGAIVDEAALVNALQQGKLAAAGLDVFETEPLPANSPLRKLNNVIITPHIGWTVEEVFEEFAQIACTQLTEYLEGRLSPAELYKG